MSATRVADVIVPAVWNPYIVEQTAARSALWQSGVVAPVPELAAFQSEGGNTINLPFWQDLSGNSEILASDGTALTVNAMSTEKDIAVVLARGKSWGASELASALAGSDPLMALGDRVADWWARDMQDTLVAILTGVFGSLAAESPSAINTLDISALSGSASIIDDNAILDTIQLMGDQKDRLTAIMMHSAVETKLRKLDLIDYVQPSQSGSARVPMYMDKRVIVDDTCPVSSGTYETYFFGPGAFGYAEGSNSRITSVETDRDSLRGEDILISRRHFVLHPRGVKYVGAATGGGPANTLLDDAASWTRVYEAKNVRLARLKHKIA